MNKKHLISFGLTAVLLAGAGFASAQNDRGDNRGPGNITDRIKAIGELKTEVRGLMRPELVGKITVVSGNTLTVTGKTSGSRASASTTFTVDASSAVVVKGGATTTVSALGVGDVVVVQGTVNGSNISAKLIHSGVRVGNGKPEDRPDPKSMRPVLANNGQPIITGKVTVVNGSSLSLLAAASTTYTIDASSAVIKARGGATTTLSAITVGDTVVVQGTVNGSTVVATTIVDHDGAKKEDGERKGFLRGIGGWFRSFFGFWK